MDEFVDNPLRAYLRKCTLAEDLNFECSLQLSICPQTRPANFKHVPNDGVGVLRKAFEDGCERVAVLFEESCFN